MRTRLCVGSASTPTRYVRLGVTDCARLFVGNSLYCPPGDYSTGDYYLCVTDGNAIVKHHMLLGVARRRSVWVTRD